MLHELLSTVLMKKYYVSFLIPIPCRLLLIFLNCGSPGFPW